MPHLLGDELRGVGVDHIGDLRHLALSHQQLDDIDRALRHAVGEFLDGDRLGQHDFARKLLLGLLGAMALQTLGAAAERGDRARALFLARRRAGDRQPAAVALFGAAGRPRRQDTFVGCARAPADDPLGVFFFAVERAARRAPARRSRSHGRGAPRTRLARHRHRRRRRRARRRRGAGALRPRSCV